MTTYESTWVQYAEPEEAGWSTEKLSKAKRVYERMNSTAALIIYEGKVLAAWGDITKNTNAHSVRKSFLNALYGIQVEQGTININSSLEELDISDVAELTEMERQATVSDLIQSRSGIYLAAGQESRMMERLRPQRGRYSPGDHFYYNNWDFNVLGTIYNQQADSDLFMDFKQFIADPLGMEDFSLEFTNYKYDSNRSIHPSYLFRVSARDMARFGQLYLQKGRWDTQQIISERWIKQSTTTYSSPPNHSIYGYGFLWWVAEEGEFADKGLYSAIGRYGQSIDILPEENIVFVHRVDSNKRLLPYFYRVESKERMRLLKLVLEAKVSEPKETPLTKPGITSIR